MTTIVGEKLTRALACNLTPDEFVARASDLARADAAIDEAEAAEKERAREAKEHIGGLKMRKRELRRVVSTRKEMRDVLCTWCADWASKTMILRRDDTLEPVEVRTMTAEELQTSFDITPKERRLGEDDNGPIDIDGSDA
jgi:hypothetical protein